MVSSHSTVSLVQKNEQRAPCLLLVTIFLLMLSVGIRAEQLPIKVYTTADGLPRNNINRIVRDSHGFLWFCTVEGLSLFDGYTFTNYGVEQGLPDRDVRDLIEARSGEYWIATQNGLARFTPNAASEGSIREQRSGKGPTPYPRFITYKTDWNSEARHVMTLLEDRDGAIWCGTSGGLCRLEQTGGEWHLRVVDLGVPEYSKANSVTALLQDRNNALWIGTWDGLHRRWPDGRVERYSGRSGLPSRGKLRILSLLEDHEGRLWVGTTRGLYPFTAKPDPNQLDVVSTFTTKQGLPGDEIDSLLSSGEKIWVGTEAGLAELSQVQGAQEWRIKTYPTVLHAGLGGLAEDREGNLWMGTQFGAIRLARNGFTTYPAEDGFGHAGVNSIVEDQIGRLCVTNKVHNKLTLHWFDGNHFVAAEFALPPWIKDPGWGWNQVSFQDHLGEWWLATGQGLCRYPKVSRVEQLAHSLPRAIYTAKDGLVGGVFRIFEDSHGDVWAAGGGDSGDFLVRWERATGAFHSMLSRPVHPSTSVTAFAEDRKGNIWMGLYWHNLARYHDGGFTIFTPADGLPDGTIFSLYVDHLGRLWIATSRGGLARIDDPGGGTPRFVKFPGIEGLSGTDVECITEDQWGRIYVGTGHGLYRFDPETGRVKRYTAADGLAGDPIVTFRDHNGALWFGGPEGLSRFVPELEAPESRASPPIRVTRLRVAGLAYPISELGAAHVAGLVLDPDQNDLQVDFAGWNFGVGDEIRYQFRLEASASNHDWSPPADQRSLNFARLKPGTYRLAIRALDSEGRVSAEPATVAFQVLAPVWQRAWFLVAAGLLVTIALYSLYRRRVAHLVELERVRTRIATDLHDDIGASLSGMAFLSEAVKREVESARPEASEMASEVAVMARGLARALSDVVWSIDPRRDDLHNLITRVRQYAAAVLEAQGISWTLEEPHQSDKLKLTPEQRHHLFLIFKESLNNVARHAQCASTTLTITVQGHELRAEIVDDGRGFSEAPSPGPAEEKHQGNGLNNMKLRAAQLGGRINVVSAVGCGTRLELAIPLK